MATGWQMQGKLEKPGPLIEALALHHLCEFAFIGEHMFSSWGGWNNKAVLLNNKISGVQNWNRNSAEPSDTQAYPTV